jgi:hypothetical protein
VKVPTKSGAVPVGEITRTADGKISAHGLPAPAFDDLGKKIEQAWRAYKRPDHVAVSEMHLLNSGMHHEEKKFTYTFDAKDRLFSVAVLKQFIEKQGYESPRMPYIQFVDFDRSAEGPEDAKDRGSTFSNFRKATDARFNFVDGKMLFPICKVVRKYRNPGRGRVSASDAKLAVAINVDEGQQEIARAWLYEDGRITVEARTAAATFEEDFGPGPREDVDLHLVQGDGSSKVTRVPKQSPQVLEAFIVAYLEGQKFYDITPEIDPAKVH